MHRISYLKVLLSMFVLCLAFGLTPSQAQDVPGDELPDAPAEATGSAESAVLEACYEQLGVFVVPVSEAEAYLPEGFEVYLPEGFEPENVTPSGETAPLQVWSINCEPVHEKEEPLNMVWMNINVDPPQAYRSDDVDSYSVPVYLFTSSPTLVETLHAFGIAQAELSDVTHEVSEQADTVRTGLAHAAGGGEEVTMESHVAGLPTPSEGFEVRNFGVEDGEVTGVVDLIISDFDTMPGEASLTENTFFSEQILESVYSVHAWEIEFHLEPVEISPVSSNQDEETLRRLEREVFDAWELPGDAEAIDRLYSEDFLAINADASYSDKRDAVEIVEAGRFPVMEEIVNDETRVRQFGDTAVITGRSEYVDPEEDRTSVVRHTMIWVKEDGRWQMVGWQGTPLPGEGAYGPERDGS